MNILNEYELIIILRPDLDDATTIGIVERLEGIILQHNGTLLIRDDWGKRKLAYPIQKHFKGHYFLITFISQAEFVKELERNVRNIDSIVRFLTSRMAVDVDVPTRMEAAAEYKRLRLEEEARARIEAETRGNDMGYENYDEDLA